MIGRQVVVCSAVRTPMGRHGGQLAGVRVDELAALVISEAVARARLDPVTVELVAAGCVNTSGEAMGNLARYAALLAGLPHGVAGVTLNHFCGSGLAAINAAAHAIATGEVDVAVAVGAESMSRSTWSVPKPATPFARHELVGRDTMWSGAGGPYNPQLVATGAMIEMPETAQNLADRYEISRAEQDAYAVESHRRAAAAADEGRFADELVAVPTAAGEVGGDETIRRDTSVEKLAKLSGYFEGCPDITAGNASQINDGASALVLAEAQTAQRLGLPSLAHIRSTAVAGVDPAVMGLGPTVAIPRALRRAELNLDQIDLVEINEAFASQTIACLRDLGLDHERTNVNGGAIALGHALGNSGTRIVTTLLHELRRRGGRYGVASLCIGGGQGVATVFEPAEAA